MIWGWVKTYYHSWANNHPLTSHVDAYQCTMVLTHNHLAITCYNNILVEIDVMFHGFPWMF